MDITSANAVLMLGVTTIFQTPTRVTNFSADAMWATDDVESAEIGKGADGNLYAGYTPYNTPQTITLMPDSPWMTRFEQWQAAQKANMTMYPAFGTLYIPSLGKKWAMTKGILGRTRPIPNAGKILAASEFQIVWDDVSPAPL